MNAQVIDQLQSDVRATFDRVSALAPTLAQSTAAERISRMRRLIEVLMEHRQAVYDAVLIERGISPADMNGELLMVKLEAEYFYKNLEKWLKPNVVTPSLMTVGKKCYMRYEPKGTVLVLPSWNGPFVISMVPVLGAIAAGNAIILKPSELAPHSSKVLADVIAKAFPDGSVTAVEGGAETAQSLLACPFNHIFYIGNNTVGRIIMKAAADHFASVTLEMGGKNPSIIDASANLDEAALKTAWGRMCNAGQACIAPDYVLVHESIAQKFTENLVREINSMYDPKGVGVDKSPDYARIINARHFTRINRLLDDARAKGAVFACGGHTIEKDRFIAPTVVTNVNDSMALMEEEIFGPVVAIIPFKTREEAIRIIRKKPKPLALYIFATDREQIDFFLQNTTSGSTVVNHNLIQAGTNPAMGFGGVNSSGIGRMVGFNTFLEASNARGVIEDGPVVGKLREQFPPLTDKYKKQLSDLLALKSPMPRWVIAIIHGVLRLRHTFGKS